MTDLEAFHWLKKMGATVLLEKNSDYTVVIVPLGERDVIQGSGDLTVKHDNGIIEVRGDSLQTAVEGAVHLWKNRGNGEVRDSASCVASYSAGVCLHCDGITDERSEIDNEFRIVRVIRCTTCKAMTFISPEIVDEAKARGGASG